MKQHMSPEEFAEVMQEAEILDVRTPMEYQQGHIPGARNVDIAGPDFMDTISSLDRSRPYALYCRSGSRSGMAIQLMNQLGFEAAGHLETGLLDWNRELVSGSEEVGAERQSEG